MCNAACSVFSQCGPCGGLKGMQRHRVSFVIAPCPSWFLETLNFLSAFHLSTFLDMDIGIISTRYAKTLLRFATDNKEGDKVYAEMQTLAESFRQVPALQQTLLNPVLTAKQKEEILICAAVGKETCSTTTCRFLQLVVQNKRADLMMFIANTFVELYLKSKNLIKGRLVVPTTVSEGIQAKLRKIVEDRTRSKVEFSTEVNPALGGGFVLEYDTYRLDASLRTQMQELRRTLA